MHVSGGMGAHQGLMSQSLPSGGKLSFKGRAPHQPLIRPINPSGSMLADLPELDMPEPSPHSNSLLTTGGGRLGELREDDDEEEEGGTSMLEVTTRHAGTFEYAASAPATMLWGPVGHRPGGSAMGGRTPSKTLLAAMNEGE